MLIDETSWVMKTNSVFIMWMPYNAPLVILDGVEGIKLSKVLYNFTDFSQSDCENNLQKGDNGTVFTICDAGSETKGMARIYEVFLKTIWFITEANLKKDK